MSRAPLRLDVTLDPTPVDLDAVARQYALALLKAEGVPPALLCALTREDAA